MTTRFSTLLTTIREKKTLDDTVKEQLNAALKEFNEQFVATAPAPEGESAPRL
jgi:hypothetical protein